MHRFLPLALVLAFRALPAAEEASAEAKSARPAQSGGVSIQFDEIKLPDGDRSPKAELQAILSAKAVLKVERPLRYRSVVLPAGAYAVAIAADEEKPAGRNFYFVIGPAEGQAVDRSARAPEEKKSEREGISSGAKPAGRDAKAALGSERPGAEKMPKKGPELIRAIFHLSPAAKPTDGVQFSVRPTARGDRFTLSIGAGSSRGKATLRFAD